VVAVAVVAAVAVVVGEEEINPPAPKGEKTVYVCFVFVVGPLTIHVPHSRFTFDGAVPQVLFLLITYYLSLNCICLQREA